MKLLSRVWVAALSGWLSTLPVQAQTDGIFADISTSLGSFTVQLDYQRAPHAVANFVGLTTGAQRWRDPENGSIRSNNFFVGSRVHLINYDDTSIPGVTNVLGFRAGFRPVRDGFGTTNWSGGPGYSILDETTNGLSHSNGVIAMVQLAPHTAGSEFVVTRTIASNYWDGLQTVFGRVVSNMAVVEAISGIPMVGGFPQVSVMFSNVQIRRVGAAAEAFDVSAWNLPQVAWSESSLQMKGGTNLSSISYDVPPKCEYFIIHTTNMMAPSWSFNSMGFNSQTQSFRATNAFSAQPGAFGPVHFFHTEQAVYPVFSAINIATGIEFLVQWTDSTLHHYYLDLTWGQYASTGTWVAASRTPPFLDITGKVWSVKWQTRTGNCTEFDFFDDYFGVGVTEEYDYTLGFEAEGATTGRFYMDLLDPIWHDLLWFTHGPCIYAPWAPH